MRKLLLLLCLLVLIGCKQVDITETEKAHLTTIDALWEWDIPEGTENYTKEKYFDGSYSLEYEFETDGFYLSHIIEVEASNSDAKQLYWMTNAVLDSGFEEFAQAPLNFSHGTESDARVFFSGEEISGGMLQFREEEIVSTVVVIGAIFTEEEFITFLEDSTSKVDSLQK